MPENTTLSGIFGSEVISPNPQAFVLERARDKGLIQVRRTRSEDH